MLSAVGREALETLPVGRLAIRYRDAGAGEPVILVHCSSASHREWTGLIAAIDSTHRVLAPDLVGYGKSDPWPAGDPFDAQADVNILLGLANLVDAPVHLVGHSYGGAIALEAARLLGPRVKSLVLIEPVAFHLLRLADRAAEWAEVRDIGAAIQRGVAEGNPRKAASVYMSYWVGRPRWWLMSRKARANVVRTIGKVASEFGLIGRLETPMSAYAAIDAPATLLVGERTRSSARAVIDVLADLLPNARMAELGGAGHMSPLTHPKLVNDLITEHLKQNRALG
jgi:pimeloyl-ACP methyl ester carboxylesterase